MAVGEEERRYLYDRIAEVTDERAARAMSDMFDDAGEDDPGLLARFDQQDAAIHDLSGRMGLVEHAVTELSGRIDRVEYAVTELSGRMTGVETELTHFQFRVETKLDGFRSDMEGLLHREIGTAIASQTRTVFVGIVAVTAAMFGMLLAVNQLL